MEDSKNDDYDTYLWVWEGHCRKMLEGAVFSKELAAARMDNRITKVPYDPRLPVDVFFDLGHADSTAIWFRQYGGFQFRYINYYENSQHHIDHYLKHMQGMGYVYGTVYLPHDAKARTIGTKVSVEEQVKAKGFTTKIVPKLSVSDSINAARTIFPLAFFDEDKCDAGLQCLMHYRYDKDPNTGELSKKPVHDQYSHGADAFRYSGIKSKDSFGRRAAIVEVSEAAASSVFKKFGKKFGLGAQSWMR